MSMRISRSIWFAIGLVVVFGMTVLVTASSADSTSKADPAPVEQFSVSRPADAETIRAAAAPSDVALQFVTGSVLPGNSAPEPVSEIGVASMPDGKEMVVARVGASMCVMNGADAGCGEVSGVAEGKLVGARPAECGSYWVFGLVPDGVEQIQIDAGNDGKVDEVLPVVDNVYEGVLQAQASTAIGVGDSGARLFETGLPLDYFAETNGACK